MASGDLDIYRAADAIVKQHGEDAPIHAAMRADAMLEVGDLDGYAVWKRILPAVEELQGTATKSGSPLPPAVCTLWGSIAMPDYYRIRDPRHAGKKF